MRLRLAVRNGQYEGGVQEVEINGEVENSGEKGPAASGPDSHVNHLDPVVLDLTPLLSVHAPDPDLDEANGAVQEL